MPGSPRPAIRRTVRAGGLAVACLAALVAVGGTPAAAAPWNPAAQAAGPAPTVPGPVADLEADLTELAAQVPGELGVVLLDPSGAPVAARNADRPFTSASLYKLFVAHAVLDRVDRGAAALTDTVPGTDLTVREALERMITWSDNVSGAALGRWVGWREVQAFAQEHGFESTTFDPDSGTDGIVIMTTTPDDVAGFLHRLRNHELLSGPSTDLLLGFLAGQQLNYALSTGLSADVQFAHKTGLLVQVSHDAGLLRLNGHEYAVAVLTDGWSGYEASRPWFQRAGRALDEYLHAVAGS